MRIAYLSGPANGPSIHEEWQRGSQEYFGTDYMKQFLQLSVDLGAESWVITWHGDKAYTQEHGRFLFDNRPLYSGRGAMHYLGQLWWHMRLWPKLLAFRPDLLVLTGNQNFWWTLAWTRLLGTRFLPSFHCTLWPKLAPVRRSSRVLLALERLFVLRHCETVVVTSYDIAAQVAQMTDAAIVDHLPSYSPQQFADVAAPVWGAPFRVIFMGRVEANKGIFDVLEMARQLPHCTFDICGSGTAMEQAAAEATANVVFHGFCNQDRLKTLMGQAHVSVVPTRSDFEAGFEMTCAEAILAGRPLVTSAACPALEYLRPASIEVTPDDVAQYVAAIRRLASDHAFYEEKRAATGRLKAQFFDPANSWLTAMKNALGMMRMIAAPR